MHLTFWQPMPSPHQRGLLEALALAPWVSSVRLRYESPLSEERRAQGWSLAEFEGVNVARIAPGEVPKTGADEVNIFTGFLTHAGVWSVFSRIPSGAPGLCLAYTEAPELRGMAGIGRSLKYRINAKRLKNRIHGVLALGNLGADFYRKLLGPTVPVTAFAYYDRSERDRVLPEIGSHLAGDRDGAPSVGAPLADDRSASGVGSHLACDRGSSGVPDTSGQATEPATADGRSQAAPLQSNLPTPPPPSGLSPQVAALPKSPPAPALPPPPLSLPSAPSASPFTDLNIVINGLDLQSGSLSLATSHSSSGFSAQVPALPSALPPPPSGSSPQDSGLPADPPAGLPPAPPRHVAPMLGKIGAVHSNTRRLLFVGQCIWRKGLDQLLMALASMPPSTPHWVLDVVGTGTEVSVFMHLAEKLDLVDRVRFREVVKGPALDKFYLRADLVIVPSRWDGWGMVVNEALFAGVPVAATDTCGSASVIRDLPRCMVLPAARTAEWSEALSEWLEWGGALPADRARLQKAAETLTGEAGAELLRKTIEKATRKPLAASH